MADKRRKKKPGVWNGHGADPIQMYIDGGQDEQALNSLGTRIDKQNRSYDRYKTAPFMPDALFDKAPAVGGGIGYLEQAIQALGHGIGRSSAVANQALDRTLGLTEHPDYAQQLADSAQLSTGVTPLDTAITALSDIAGSAAPWVMAGNAQAATEEALASAFPTVGRIAAQAPAWARGLASGAGQALILDAARGLGGGQIDDRQRLQDLLFGAGSGALGAVGRNAVVGKLLKSKAAKAGLNVDEFMKFMGDTPEAQAMALDSIYKSPLYRTLVEGAGGLGAGLGGSLAAYPVSEDKSAKGVAQSAGTMALQNVILSLLGGGPGRPRVEDFVDATPRPVPGQHLLGGPAPVEGGVPMPVESPVRPQARVRPTPAPVVAPPVQAAPPQAPSFDEMDLDPVVPPEIIDAILGRDRQAPEAAPVATNDDAFLSAVQQLIGDGVQVGPKAPDWAKRVERPEPSQGINPDMMKQLPDLLSAILKPDAEAAYPKSIEPFQFPSFDKEQKQGKRFKIVTRPGAQEGTGQPIEPTVDQSYAQDIPKAPEGLKTPEPEALETDFLTKLNAVEPKDTRTGTGLHKTAEDAVAAAKHSFAKYNMPDKEAYLYPSRNGEGWVMNFWAPANDGNYVRPGDPVYKVSPDGTVSDVTHEELPKTYDKGKPVYDVAPVDAPEVPEPPQVKPGDAVLQKINAKLDEKGEAQGKWRRVKAQDITVPDLNGQEKPVTPRTFEIRTSKTGTAVAEVYRKGRANDWYVVDRSSGKPVGPAFKTQDEARVAEVELANKPIADVPVPPTSQPASYPQAPEAPPAPAPVVEAKPEPRVEAPEESEAYQRRLNAAKGIYGNENDTAFLKSEIAHYEELSNRTGYEMQKARVVAAKERLAELEKAASEPPAPLPVQVGEDKIVSGGEDENVPPTSPAVTAPKPVMKLNPDRNGVELKFPGPITDEAVKADLRAGGFRYSKPQRLWYAKQNDNALAVARKLAGEVSPAEPQAPATPQIKAPEPVKAPEIKTPTEVKTNDGGTGKAEAQPVRTDGSGILPEVPSQSNQGAEGGRNLLPSDVQPAGSDGGRAGAGSSAGTGLSNSPGSAEAGVPNTTTRTRREPVAKAPKQTKALENYRIQDDDLREFGGEKTRYRANLEAIRISKALEKEGRPATPEERKALVKYVGWGGLSKVFEAGYRPNHEWKSEYDELKGELSDAELHEARQSTENAHYTSRSVVEAVWKGVEHLGFDGGRVLEPAAGIGHFIGLAPEKVAKGHTTMVEIDPTTARITKALYPASKVINSGFEKTNLPDDYYDLAISNVPFSENTPYDPKYSKHKLTLHNYFFVKSLDKVRPGGLITFITSTGTMDTSGVQAQRFKEMMHQRADFVGAVRVPGGAFKKNAGTQVTTDVVVFRKRMPGEESKGDTSWMEHVPSGVKGGWNDNTDLYINKYFADHPEQVLGTLAKDTHYANGTRVAVEPKEGQGEEETTKLIVEAMKRMPQGIYTKRAHAATELAQPKEILPAPGDLKENQFAVVKGQLYVHRNKELHPVTDMPPATRERVVAMHGIREVLRKHFIAQADGTEAEFKKSMAELNKAYDAFVAKYGPINSTTNLKAIASDPDAYLLSQLERKYDSKTKTAQKAAIFTTRTYKKYEPITKAETASEALIASFNQFGGVNIPHMIALTGKTEAELVTELGPAVYQEPSGEWISADEYLSGNVREKLKQAEAAADVDPSFKRNVEALKAVQPKWLTKADGISVKLSSPWLPTEIFPEFIRHLVGGRRDKFKVSYTSKGWKLEKKQKGYDGYVDNVANTQKWGTPEWTAEELVEALMSNGNIQVKYKDSETGKDVLDVERTEAARAKAAEVAEEFQRWAWEKNDQFDLETIYNEKINNLAPRTHDGSHLQFPGMTPWWQEHMRPHQKNAVWRALQGGNTLFAHAVGAGKTAEMVATAMEMRRLGIANKPLLSVPKNIIPDFKNAFSDMYPLANVLVMEGSDFSKDNRRKAMAKIATGDFDAVIVSHESLGKLALGPAITKEFYMEQIRELEEVRLLEEQENGKSTTAKQLAKSIENLQNKMESAIEGLKKDDAVYFEELGVDGLIVDEAHLFKNLMFSTRKGRIKGIGTGKGSKRALDLYSKVRYLQSTNGGRGVVFATGTPISNTMGEMYLMMKYLAPKMLEDAGLRGFDAWADTFGQEVTEWEMAPEGGGYRQTTRFSEFVNAPELSQMFRSFADVQTAQMLFESGLIQRPKLKGGEKKVIVAKPSPQLQDYFNSLVARAEAVRRRTRPPQKGDDIMLTITTDGRKAAVDLSLVIPGAPDDPGSKVNQAVDKIANIYKATEAKRSTQIVFLDLGTPKGKEDDAAEVDEEGAEPEETEDADTSKAVTSVYGKIKSKLIKKGVKPEEIAIIHDYNTVPKKERLFAAMNSGEVRILLGSSGKMGVGMNVQKKLIALHHLDGDWKPATIEQREGRILRQGNENPEVEIYTYVTERSLDSFMWETVARKARFIEDIMRGDLTERSVRDVSDEEANYKQLAAEASGMPEVKELAEVSKKLRNLQISLANHERSQLLLKRGMAKAKEMAASEKENIENIKADMAKRKDLSGDKFTMKVKGKTYTKRAEADEALKETREALESKLSKLQAGERIEDTVGEISGFDVKLVALKPYAAAPEVRAHLVGSKTYDVQLSTASIEQRLRRFDDSLKFAETELEKAQREAKSAEAELGKEFAHGGEIKTLEARKVELQKILDLDKKAEDAGYYSESMGYMGPSGDPDVDKTLATPGEPVSRVKINQQLAKVLPVYRKRLRVKKRQGEYLIKDDAIRLKNMEDMQAMAHELGHHLNFTEDLDYTGFESELQPLGKAMYPSYTIKEQLQEGVAEFVRLWFNDPAKAKQVAPTFDAHFESYLDGLDKEVRGHVKTLRAMYDLYRTQDDYAKARGRIENDQLSPETEWLNNLEKFHKAWVDDNYDLYKFMAEMTPDPIKTEYDVPEELNVYVKARLHAAWPRKAAALIFDKATDPTGKVVGESLHKILEPHIKDGDLEQTRVFLTMLRVQDLDRRGIPSGFEDIDWKGIIKQLDTPQRRETAKKLSKWSDNLLDWEEHYGVLTKDAVQAIRHENQFYFPMYRVFEGAGLQSGRQGPGFANLRSMGKKVRRAEDMARGEEKGSIIDPFQSLVRNAFNVMEAVSKQDVLNSMVGLYDKAKGRGDLMMEVPAPVDGHKTALEYFKDELEAQGVDTSQLDMSAIVNTYRAKGYPSPGERQDYVVMARTKTGKNRWFRLHPAVYDAFMKMGPSDPGGFVRLLGMANQLLRWGITTDLGYIERNFGRDNMDRTAYSRGKAGGNFLKIIKSTLKGMGHVIKKSDLYTEADMNGAFQATVAAWDRRHYKEHADEVTKPIQSRIHPILWMLRLQEAVEEANYMGDYIDLKDAGYSPKMAAFAARDRMDFNKQGSYMRTWNKFSIFSNAQVQGVNNFFRLAKRDPGRWAWMAAAMVVYGMMEWFLNNEQDEEKWMNEAGYKRDRNMLIYVGGKTIQLPMSQEWGIVKGTIQRTLDAVKHRDPQQIKELGKSLYDTFVPSFMPTIGLGIYENMANYDSFTGAPIENLGDKYKAGPDRFGPKTHESTKVVSNALFKTTGWGPSPKKVDNFVKDTFGTMGQTAMSWADVAVTVAGANNRQFRVKASDLVPAFKGMGDTGGFPSSPARVTEFYDEWERLQGLYGSAKKFGRRMSQEDMRAYGRMKGAAKSLANINKMIKAYEQRGLTQQVEPMRRRMAAIAANALGKR